MDEFFLLEGDPPSKREILRCALELFVRDGLCATSIRDIAQASGYTNPALYKFFESKDALALHLFERCYHRLATAVHDSQRRADFEADLEALVSTYARLVDENLDAVLFVDDTLRHFWPKLPKSARRHSLVAEVRALLRRGVASGAVPRDLDEDIAVATVLGAFGQIARMAYFDEIDLPLVDGVPAIRKQILRALSERS